MSTENHRATEPISDVRYKVVRSTGSVLDQFHIFRLGWSVGVPRELVWHYLDTQLTGEGVLRIINETREPGDNILWET